MDLIRITTQYVDIEDRIVLLGESLGGQREEFLLTQRLLIRMLPVLTVWLVKSEGVTAAQALNSFKQGSALTSLNNSPPVPHDLNAQRSLVQSVDISYGEDQTRLRFRSNAQDGYVLTLSKDQLRQWLGILYSAFVQADWPLASWPDWIKGEASPIQRHVYLH